MCTVNVTAWKDALQFLATTQYDAVMIPEIAKQPGSKEEAAASVIYVGYRRLANPSAGVAVVSPWATALNDVSFPKQVENSQLERFYIAGWYGGIGKVAPVASVYLYSVLALDDPANASLVSAIAALYGRDGRPSSLEAIGKFPRTQCESLDGRVLLTQTW